MTDTSTAPASEQQNAVAPTTETTPAATEAQAPAAPATTETPAATESNKVTAPGKYELTAPEGREFDASVLTAFSDAAREVGLDNAAAQKVIDVLGPALAAKQETVLAEARTAWKDAVQIDKEIGGEKLAENIAVAQEVFKAYGTPELQALLEQSGLGDHPEVLRWAFRTSKALGLGGDKVLIGSNSTAAPDTIARRMYPNMNP